MSTLLENENRIIDCILSTVFAGGYEVSIFDGEEFVLRRTSDVTTIKEALNSTGLDWLRVLKKDDPYQIGSILLIYNNGNDGIDLIANTASGDHAAFDALLKPVYDLVDSMGDDNKIWYTSSCGKIEFTFRDMEQVLSMHHSGDCEESVKSELPYFLETLKAIPRETIESVLLETGAWNSEELAQETDSDLYVKLLWIASGDVHDREQMEDLCQWQNDFLAERRRED